MNKLIKLSPTHYIIIDDSEIKKIDYYYLPRTNNIHQCKEDPTELNLERKFGVGKVTHSTLKINESTQPNTEFYWNTIKPLSLSEVEEAIYGYNLEKMAGNFVVDKLKNSSQAVGVMLGYIEGFKAHQELVKDKFILSKNDILKIITMSREAITPHGIINMESWISSGYEGAESAYSQHQIIESLLPKTEWNCTFNEEGKLIIQN